MATSAVLRLPSLTLTATPPLPPLQTRPARRRTTPQQGRALEVLGHAIEYLVDSRLVEGGPTMAENGAIRVLMACSRTVFEERRGGRTGASASSGVGAGQIAQAPRLSERSGESRDHRLALLQ